MTAVAVQSPSDLDRFLEAIWRQGDVREVRMPGGPRGTDSGYFDDPAKLASAVDRYDGRENIYLTINPVNPSLIARASNRIAGKTRTTTSDVDIVERRWLPIDLDPVRASGISASDDERENALATARAVYGYLNGLGWPDPVTAMSGNGYWLLYPIELPNDEASKALVEGVLKHLSQRFSSPAVSIDTSVSNAARIVALIGTMKVKGDATPERPHRRSTLTFCPPELVAVPREKLEELTPTRPIIVPAAQSLIRVGRMPEGWVRDALNQRGVQYREGQRNGRTWFRLQQCPFHPDDDQGGDCGVGEDSDGKGLGHCFHNRGQGMGWRDFKSALGLETSNVVQLNVVQTRPAGPEPIGMDAADLLDLDLPPLRWIVPDLIPEGTTILAAPPKVGKSCLVYQVAVEASIGGDLLGRRVTPGSVLYLALEDGKRRGQVRLRAVLAGRTMPRGRCEIRWNAPAIGQGLEESIAAWLDDHADAVLVAVDTLGKVKPPSAKGRNAYDVDVELFTRLHGMFKDTQVGLLIVHHAKKGSEDDFLAQVSGTYGITGSADTTILIERKREDQFGQIHVTGRDVADASIPARFDGLLWLDAPDVSGLRFEGNETYKFLLESDRAWMPTALAAQLDVTPDAMKKRLQTLQGSGLVIRVDGGYTTNNVRLLSKSKNPLSVPPLSPPPKREEREGVDKRAYARTSAREDTPWMTPTNTTGEWASLCRDYRNHQSYQRRTDAGWICTKCEEDA